MKISAITAAKNKMSLQKLGRPVTNPFKLTAMDIEKNINAYNTNNSTFLKAFRNSLVCVNKYISELTKSNKVLRTVLNAKGEHVTSFDNGFKLVETSKSKVLYTAEKDPIAFTQIEEDAAFLFMKEPKLCQKIKGKYLPFEKISFIKIEKGRKSAPTVLSRTKK